MPINCCKIQKLHRKLVPENFIYSFSVKYSHKSTFIQTFWMTPQSSSRLKLEFTFKVIECLTSGEYSLVNAAKEMMLDLVGEVATKRTFLGNDIYWVLRRLLVARTWIAQGENTENTQRKEKFSELIKDVMETEGTEAAKRLMEVGFHGLPRDDDKGFIAQALARLLMDNFEEAEKWALEAKNRLPNNFTMNDTVGHVYKQRLM